MSQVLRYTRVCGIDLGKTSLQLHLVTPETTLPKSLDYDEAGCQKVIELCQQHQVQLVVLEATGGLQRKLAVALVQAKVPVAILNPSRIRHYALGEGMLAKTDTVDAAILASFALKIAPKPTAVRTAQQEQLARLAARKSQLTWAKVDELNRLQQEGDADAIASLRRHLKFLEKELARVDGQLEQLVYADPALEAKVEAADTLVGVGPASAIALVVQMPELGTLTRKQVGSLAGVAPFAKESGQSVGERHIQGGRAPVRSILYMCTLTAVRCQGKIQDFYQTLLKAGKCKMVALTACMHKMLTIINARVRDAMLALGASTPQGQGGAAAAAGG
jgi:transposase